MSTRELNREEIAKFLTEHVHVVRPLRPPEHSDAPNAPRSELAPHYIELFRKSEGQRADYNAICEMESDSQSDAEEIGEEPSESEGAFFAALSCVICLPDSPEEGDLEAVEDTFVELLMSLDDELDYTDAVDVVRERLRKK